MKLQGHSYVDDVAIEITTQGNRIENIASSTHPPEGDFIIGPGFTDLQINGYGGIDYNETQVDPLHLALITKALFKVGVTFHLPTIITNDVLQINKLIRQVLAVCKEDELVRLSIGGLHLEGPFISPLDGPRGAHPKEFVRPPDWDLVQRWQDEAGGAIKMITLSPEWENANPVIEQCVKNNILIAIGHTNASHKQIQDAVSAGARLSTHLGNGMHPMIARHPNYLWSQLAADKLGASIIADGFHLPQEVIQIFKKVKQENLILISDSVSLAGMPPGDYDLHIGGQVTLTKEGKLHLRNNPSIFAGSASNIFQGVCHLVDHNLASLAEAWQMASTRPMRFLDPGARMFESGAAADFVIMKRSEGKLGIAKTFKNGVAVYSD